MNFQSEKLLIEFLEDSNAKLNSSTPDSVLNDALKILAKAADVDRAYICKHLTEYDTDEMYFSLVYKWASDKVENQIESPNFRKISYARFSLLNFYENLSNGRSLRFVLKDLKDEEKMGFLDSKIKSIVLIPFIFDDTYWGFLGLDEINTDKIWTEFDIEILTKFAAKLAFIIKEGEKEKQKRLCENIHKLSLIDEENLFSVFSDDDKPDEQSIAEILTVYVRDIPLMAKEIDVAIENTNASELKYHTHKLAGSLLNLGAEYVVRICHQIEKLAEENIIDEKAQKLNIQLQENIKRLQAELIGIREKFLIANKT